MSRFKFVTGALRDIAVPAGALFLFAGVALTWNAAESALEYRNAVELNGVVTGKELVRADREKNRSTRFVARYRVVLPDGERVEADEDLPRIIWEARAVGDAHPMLYLPAKRKTLPPAGSDYFVSAIIMGVIGPVFAIVGWLLLRKPARQVIARLRLLDRGVQATATVTDVFQTSTSVNRMILWQLRYRYRDLGGAEHEAPSDLLTPEEAAEWQAGATGPILYDPVRPTTSAWLGPHAAPPHPAAPGLGACLWSKTKTLLRWVINLAFFFAALIAAAVIGELVPELKQLEVWMNDQRMPLVFATGGAALLGVFLLIGAVISMIMEGGEPMSHTDIENQQRSMRDAAMGPRIRRMSTYRLFGTGAGGSAHDEFSMSELKRAMATGAILRDPQWLRRLCAGCGAMLMFLGLFGSFIVISPLALKLVLAVVVLYALVRIACACVRA